MQTPVQADKFAFESFEVDRRTEEIWRGTRRVKCQRQPFRVLWALLERPGEVVSKEELRQALWGSDSPADADHSLGIAINKLREALGDSADSPHFIETLPRRGYRFLAAVTVVADSEHLPNDPLPVPVSGPATQAGPALQSGPAASTLAPAALLPSPAGSPPAAAPPPLPVGFFPIAGVGATPVVPPGPTGDAALMVPPDPVRPPLREPILPSEGSPAGSFSPHLAAETPAHTRAGTLAKPREATRRLAALWPVAGARSWAALSLAVMLAGVCLLFAQMLAGGLHSDATLSRRMDQVTHNDSIFPGVANTESFPELASDGPRIYSSTLDEGQTQVASIDAGTGDTQPLQLPAEIVNPLLSDISPDGQRLLVRSHPSSDSEQPIWVVPRGGGSAQRVGNIRAHDAAWMPDGESVLYAAGNQLNVIRLDDGAIHNFATLPGRAFWMRWAPDGKRLRMTIFDPLAHTSELWQMTPGHPAQPLLPGWTTPASECCGVWTSDGSSYIFQSSHRSPGPGRPEGGSSDIWQMRGRGSSRPERLTNGPLSFMAPTADPAGHRIYFVGLDGRSELHRFDPALGHFVEDRGVLETASRVTTSADRRWVAWTDITGHLWKARTADGGARAEGPNGSGGNPDSAKVQLSPDGLEVFLAQWSPDGRSLVAMARQAGHSWQLVRISADGGSPEMLLQENRNEADPTWSPDGRKIAFGRTSDLLGRESGPKQIEILDLATHKVEALPGSDNLFSPRWSPDGRWIVALTLGEQRLMLFDTRARTWTSVGAMRGADPVWSRDSTAVFLHTAFSKVQTIERIALPDGRSTTVATLTGLSASDQQDCVFVGLTPEQAPLVRVRTATGNLFTLAVGR